MKTFPAIEATPAEGGWVLTIPRVYWGACDPRWVYLGDQRWGVRTEDGASIRASGLAPLCTWPDDAAPAEALPEAHYASTRKPFPHQRQAVQWILDHPATLLADEQGLCKTLSAIDAVRARRDLGDAGPVLVVTRRSILPVWEHELHTADPDYAVGVLKNGKAVPETPWVLATYDSLGRHLIPDPAFAGKPKPLIPTPDSLLRRPWHTVILDEVHAVKNAHARRTRAILYLQSPYKIMITGTPVINTFSDLWFPLFWTRQTSLSWWAFLARYGTPNEWGQWHPKWDRIPELNRLLLPIEIRRTKAQTVHLPPKIVQDIPVVLGKRQRAVYTQAKNDWLLETRTHPESLQNPLVRLLRFKQITGGLHLVSETETDHAKWDTFRDLYADALEAGSKIVLYTQFRDQWQWLMDHCAAWHPVGIRGDTPDADRKTAMQRFQTDPACQVFVMTRAGGEGITLTAAQTIVFFDWEWSPAANDQIADRLHRIGQTGTVNVVRLVAHNTIDERILHHNLADKEVLRALLGQAPSQIL